MRTKIGVLCCLLVAVVLFVGYEYAWAKDSGDQSGPNIGTVSIRTIYQECKRNVKYREEASDEQEKLINELEKLKAEIDLADAGLRTLKPSSDEYMQQMREIMQKQASLQAQQEFYKQKLSVKDQRWTEQLYGDILKATAEIAQQKGLAIVLEKSEPELPAISAEDLIMSIRTNKVLFSEPYLEITDEVMARVDKMK